MQNQKTQNTRMTHSNSSDIPLLDPTQFHDYIFQDWVPKVQRFFEEFHIAKIEDYREHIRVPLLPHKRSVSFFMFITKGKIIRSKGLSEFEVLPNNFFLLPAHQITSVEYISPDIEGYYCHFMPEIINDQWIKTLSSIDFSFFQFIGNPLVAIKNPERITQLLKILEDEYIKNETERFRLIVMYLLTLLAEVSLQAQHVDKQNKNAATILTQRYKNALSELIYEKKTVAEFADYLSVTPNHLHKCVKAATGKSAHQLLDEMRLLEAKVLLRQTTLSIGEIAYKVGKFDHSDFTRFFRSKTNTTPQKYRQGEN